MHTAFTDFGSEVRLRIDSGRILVQAHYNGDWVQACHNLQGKYRGRTRIWSFEIDQLPKVAGSLNSIFKSRVPLTLESFLDQCKLSRRAYKDAGMAAANDRED